jgi:predicted  nucleic acid-binding Zn-ribbon protein
MGASMHPQLEILLQIQDLRAQRQELAETSSIRDFEEKEFGIDIGVAVGQLDEKIEDLRQELTQPVRGRLDRMIKAGRPVVPLINGVCYGCFVAIPTSTAGIGNTTELRYCDNCGRFLYVVG